VMATTTRYAALLNPLELRRTMSRNPSYCNYPRTMEEK
jgi:hypothetical protein